MGTFLDPTFLTIMNIISPRIDKPRIIEETKAASCHKSCDQIKGPPNRIKAIGACSRIAIIKNRDNRLRRFGHIFTNIQGQRIASVTIATMIDTTDHFCVVADLSSSCSFCCHSDLYRDNSDALLDNCSNLVSLLHHSSHLSAQHRVESWYTPDEISCFKFCDASEKTLSKLSVSYHTNFQFLYAQLQNHQQMYLVRTQRQKYFLEANSSRHVHRSCSRKICLRKLQPIILC